MLLDSEYNGGMFDSPLLSSKTSSQVAMDMAARVRALRLQQQWTRRTLAARSGVSLGSLERFERTGKISLQSLLKIAHALASLHEFETLLQPAPAASIEELERRQQPQRKRGRI